MTSIAYVNLFQEFIRDKDSNTSNWASFKLLSFYSTNTILKKTVISHFNQFSSKKLSYVTDDVSKHFSEIKTAILLYNWSLNSLEFFRTSDDDDDDYY